MSSKSYEKLNLTLIHNLRKKIEELKSSENRFKTIFENARDGILAVDIKTKKFVFANPEICKLTGYTEKELLQLNMNNIHPKKDLPYIIDQFTKQMQGKTSLAKDMPVLRKDKDVIYCDINGSGINVNGRSLLVGFFRDITKRKKAEEALKESEEKYKLIFESSRDGLAMANLKGRFIDANKTFCDMHGYKRDELVNKKTFMEITPKKWFKHELNIIKNQVMKRGYSDSFEKEQIKKNSEVFPVNVIIHLVKDKEGNPFRMWAVVRDITEQKKAEEDLRKTKNYLDNLLNYANAPIIVWDNNKRITLFNKAFEFFTGHKQKAVLGKKIDLLFPQPQKEKILQTIEKATKGERWKTVEIPILCKDKKTKIALWNSANITDYTGKMIATIAQGQDITEIKKTEQRLKENEEKWISLTNNSNDVIIIVDQNHIINYINRVYPGYKIEKVVGKPIYNYMPKEQHNLVRGSLDKVFRTGKVGFYEVSSVIPKIGIRQFSTKLVPIKRNGKVCNVIQIVSDITYKKKAEEEKERRILEQSEEKYRRLFETAQDAILILDADTGKIIDSNPFIQNLLGYSAKELMGKQVWQISPFKNVVANKKKFVMLKKKRYARYENMPLQTKSGKIANVEFISNIYLAGGKKVMQCNIRDITKRKIVEQKFLLRKEKDEKEIKKYKNKLKKLKSKN